MNILKWVRWLIRYLYNRLFCQPIVLSIYTFGEASAKAADGYIRKGEVIFLTDTGECTIYDGQRFHPWPPMKTIRIKTCDGKSAK